MLVFSVAVLCGLVGRYHNIRETYHVHIHGQRWRQYFVQVHISVQPRRPTLTSSLPWESHLIQNLHVAGRRQSQISIRQMEPQVSVYLYFFGVQLKVVWSGPDGHCSVSCTTVRIFLFPHKFNSFGTFLPSYTVGTFACFPKDEVDHLDPHKHFCY
jgi:hypothetical protein